MGKIRSLLNWLSRSVWLGLLTFLVVTTVLPVAAQHLKIQNSKFKIQNSTDSTQLVIQNPKSKIQNSTDLTLLEQGITLYESGRFSEATELWQQAAQEYEQRSDRINQALSLSYLSLVYQDLGQWQEAERAISQSLDLLATPQQLTPDSQKILAQALNTKGSLQLAMGQIEAALDTWKQAQSAYAQAGDETGVLGCQINQAQALQALGLYRRAQMSLEQVNQKLQEKPDSLLKVTGLRSLGIALQVVGDLQKSQEVLEQSLAISQRLNSSLDISTTLFSLGNTARALQNYEKALELYQQAAERSTSPLDKLEAQLNQLSLLVQTQKQDAAIALLPQIRSQFTNLSPSRSAIYAQVNFAETLMKVGQGQDHSETGRYPQRDTEALSTEETPHRGNTRQENSATNRFTSSGLPLAPSSFSQTPITNAQEVAQLLAKAVQQARVLKDPKAESYALGQLGRLYGQTQQWGEAQNLTSQALQIAQGINASNIAYRWQWQLGQIFKQQGKLTEATAAYSEAVNTLQSLRSDLVAMNPEVQFSFRDSVEPVYRELVQLLLQPGDKEQGNANFPSSVSQENLQKAREVIESLQLAELDNYFREACLRAKPEQIDRIDPTAAVIYPIILPDRLAVILSRPGQPLSYYQTELRQRDVENILNQTLQSLNPAFSNKQRLSLTQQVYDWLIRPIEPQLTESGVKTLVFVLDGSLRNLPMAALHDGQQYLVEKYSIALSQGLQLLEPRSLSRKQLKVLIGGLTDARQGFSSLPAVAFELKQIASAVPASKVLLNQEFTKPILENQIDAAPYRVVHFATHGQFSSKVEETFLLTWNDRINVKDLDELLRVRAIDESNPIELLVLSACQTATGDNRATLGLAGVAVRSGARSTLATLWSVRDQSTAEFMAKFYRELTQNGLTKAEAVRQTQLAFLKNPQHNHPFFWAPFILVGNWL